MVIWSPLATSFLPSCTTQIAINKSTKFRRENSGPASERYSVVALPKERAAPVILPRTFGAHEDTRESLEYWHGPVIPALRNRGRKIAASSRPAWSSWVAVDKSACYQTC